MKCVILQPSYIPWRGYFHQIQKADIFVFYDDVQFDRRGWRNRNQIKTPHGLQWLTIPVYSKGYQIEHTPINKIEICWDTSWNIKHWNAIKNAYIRAPHFRRYSEIIESWYTRKPELLADFVIDVTLSLAKELGLTNKTFLRSSSLSVDGSKTDRLLAILVKIGATHYITGPSAREYIEEQKFRDFGITLEYMEYNYPEYPQLHPPYTPFVSILDLLMMVGDDAARYIWQA